MQVTPCDILAFWYGSEMAARWFASTPTLDATILARFESVWVQAAAGQFDVWQDTPEGCLALCIVLDQFPLNMFRGQARSFATEQQAVAVTNHAIRRGFDRLLAQNQLTFLYMPLMHSEHLTDQDESVRLFTSAGLEHEARFAGHHREIIRRFGRFPHRNQPLGRESTAAERVYLDSAEAFRG